MRINNSIKNIYISLISQIVIILLGFLSRKIFIDNLGVEYLGINGLLTNIISMLSLVESGIGLSIVYNLYKPLSENDRPQIIALVQLYKRAYYILAILMFLLGLIMYPLINIFIKGDTNIPYIGIVYSIFILRNIISYLNAHKWSLINADQKGYVLTKTNLYFNIVTTISKILILKITQNYILYLIVDILIFIVQNCINGYIVNKRYEYIKTKKKYSIDKELKQEMKKNVSALFLHNLAGYCVFGTDNLLISAFVGLKAVGLYSNYSMIIEQLKALVSQIINGMGASIGNLIASESKERNYEVFNVIYLINFWIYSVCTIFLYNLLEPFIIWWLGDNYLLNRFVFIMILINFYITGLRQSIQIFKTKAGIFIQDKYVPIIEAIINLGTSLIFVKIFGFAGIFIGTTMSTLCTVFWNSPRLVYREVFSKPVTRYFEKYLFYSAITIITGFMTTFFCNHLVSGVNFIKLIERGIICIVLPNIIYILIFRKSNEFKYILNTINPIILKLKNKVKNNSKIFNERT